MNTIRVIAKREIAGYFSSPIAYVFLTTYVVLATFLFFRVFFLVGQADLRPFFLLMPWVFLFYVPAVSMGKWAEERRQGTLELLLTLPIADRDVVLGKFFAGLMLVASALLATLPMAVTVAWLGKLDWGATLGGYCGLLLLGGVYLAVGLAISSLTHNQIIAFIGTVVVCFVLLVLGEPLFTVALPGPLVPLVQYLGLNFHFTSMERGVFDSRDLVYLLSVTAFALWINYRIIQRRR